MTPNRPKGRLRGAVAAGVALLGVAAFVAPPVEAAVAAPSAVSAIASGPYSASADASLIRANVSLTGALSVADLDLTHSTATVDSAGTPRSAATSYNTGTLAALNQNLDLSTVLSRASQTAPPQQPAADSQTLIPVPAAPLLDAGVSNATARALWAGEGQCVAADQDISNGRQDIANATLVSTGGTTLVGLNNAKQGVSYTTARTALPSTGGPRDERAVLAETTTQITQLDLLTIAGQANPLVHVAAVGPYVASAVATGFPGGAATSNQDPVVDISLAGNPVIRLQAGQSASFPFTTPTGLPTLDALLGQLKPLLDPLAQVITISVPPVQRVVAADGTSASISGALLQVSVLGALGTPPLASVTVAPFAARAVAPAGGIHCGQDNPLTVSKNANKQTVLPGETFDYTITVGNNDQACTINNVKVVDQLRGPEGSTVTGTNPTADSATWPTVTWNNIGSLAPGQTRQLTVTIQVPKGASPDATYGDTATATGECNGTTYNTPFTLDGIPKVVLGLLPRTGGESTLPMIAGALLVAGALGLRRLRRA